MHRSIRIIKAQQVLPATCAKRNDKIIRKVCVRARGGTPSQDLLKMGAFFPEFLSIFFLSIKKMDAIPGKCWYEIQKSGILSSIPRALFTLLPRLLHYNDLCTIILLNKVVILMLAQGPQKGSKTKYARKTLQSHVFCIWKISAWKSKRTSILTTFVYFFSETPLNLAVGIKAKPAKMLVALVNGGALVDFRSKDSCTALHKAVVRNNIEVCN